MDAADEVRAWRGRARPSQLIHGCWADRSIDQIFTAPPGSPGQHVSKARRGEQRREVSHEDGLPTR